ncbi:MAG: RagB/SusD family nutrient uptake outer membrane protein [Mediterranea sp.]|jgi:hypothetical protein|nr:RagB/SusD family nutrient uptake outer membrane protein [Mediterranea sp.]
MRFKKYIVYSSCLSLLAATLGACNFLDDKPLDAKDSSLAWQTATDAETNVNALYFGGVPYLNNTDVDGGWTPKATMWGGIMSGLFVDKKKDRTFTNASENCNFNVASFDDTSFKLYHELYKGISRANFVLANIPTMTNVLTQKQIDNYMAQGYFFRAYGYFWLVKEFGAVPYIDFPYTEPVNMQVEQTSAEDIYKHVETDLENIVEGDALPDKTFYENEGYATKAMAETLLAEVYLQHAGAPLNGGQVYYEKAANMALQVINSGTFALMSDFNSLKVDESTNNREIIYAKEFNNSLGVGNDYPCRSIYTDASQWKKRDGKTSVFNPGGGVLYDAYCPAPMILNSYDPNDLRIQDYQFFFWNYIDSATDSLYVIDHYTPGNWAWFDEAALKKGTNGSYNIPTFRYSEILLIAAEGLARTGHEDNAVGGAKYYLNQVRKRAYLPDETATGDELIQSILTERLHEFPLEFKVWDDIRRTRLYPEASTETGKLNWVPLKTATIQNKPEGQTKVGAIPEYALLWPFSLDQLQVNPKLTQNPGWN